MAEDLKPMKIGVLGVGAIGGLLAALLSRSGYKVSCFSRAQTLDSIRQQGICVKSDVFGDFIAHPNCSGSSSSNLDVVFITVKSPALESSIKNISEYIGSDTAVVTLLNGIGHRELIRKVIGPQVVVGMIGAVEVYLDDDRSVLHKSQMVPHMEIASDVDVNQKKLTDLASILQQAGISVAIGANENEVIWKKLVRLSAIATLTTYSQNPVGSIRTDKQLRELLKNLVNELCLIAQSQNVKLAAVDVMRQIDNLPESLTTSMQRDVKAGRVSEVESILGEPLRLGVSHGLKLPAMEHCYSRIQTQVNS